MVEARTNYMEAREKVTEIRSEVTGCKGDDSEECEKLRGRYKVHAEKMLLNAADRVLAVLDRIKEKVEDSEDLDEDERSDIIADIEEKIAEMVDAREVIESIDEESDIEEVGEAANTIKKAWKRSVKFSAKAALGKMINARLRGITQRMNVLEDKLDRIVSRMEEEGYDVEDSKKLFEEFSLRLSEAEENYESAKSKYAGVLTADDKEEVSEEAKELLEESHDALKKAHEILKGLLREIREAKQEGVIEETEEELEDEEETDDKDETESEDEEEDE